MIEALVRLSIERRYLMLSLILVLLVVLFYRLPGGFLPTEDQGVVALQWRLPPGATMNRSVELFHRVNEQDFDACERCQPAMSSRMYRNGGVLVPSEHHITQFHEWVSRFVPGGVA